MIEKISDINFKKALWNPKDLEFYVYLKDIKFFSALESLHIPYANTQIVIECDEDTEIPDSKYSLVLKKTDPKEKWYAKALTIDIKVKYIAIYDIKKNTIDSINELLSIREPKEDRIVFYPNEFEFINAV